MKTDHLEHIVCDYLKEKETEYALLVNGAWGSGKTFFWKNRLTKIADDSGLKPMYVSLNGISNIDKLEQQIFIQLLPKLGENQTDIVKNLTTVSKNLANAASKFFFKSDLTDIAKGTSVKTFNFKKYCICFDDLERCKIPIDELFGYLSDFVEHKNLKCIILADEPKVKEHKINMELINGYDAIKEKILGRILNYEPEIEVVVPELIEKFKSKKSVYTFFKTKQDFIISLFKDQKIDNLRIINFYLENLSKIYPGLKDEDDAFVLECIFFTAIITIEFKKGILTSKDVNDFKDLNQIDTGWYSRITSRHLMKKDKDEPREKSYTEFFYEKYLSNNIENYQFYPSLYRFILSGFFSEAIFKAELKVRKPEEVPDHIVAFRRLLNYKFRELKDETFAKLVKEVYENAKKGVYWLYDYKQIANFYLYFAQNGLIDLTAEEINKTLLSGLKKAIKRKDIHQYTYDNLMRFENENPETQTIVDEIARLHREVQVEMENEDSQKALLLIENGNKEKIATFFQDNKFKKEILPFLRPSDFLVILKKAPNEIVFLMGEIFRERYSYNNPGEFMAGDLDFLREIKTLLETYLKKTKDLGPVRKHNFNSLFENIEDSIQKIVKTQKSIP